MAAAAWRVERQLEYFRAGTLGDIQAEYLRAGKLSLVALVRVTVATAGATPGIPEYAEQSEQKNEQIPLLP